MYPSSSPPKRPHHRRRVDYTDSLPDECLALIFNFLTTTNDRNNSSLVSRRWLRIDAQTRTHLTLNARSKLQSFIPSIFNRFNSLTQLVLRNNYSTSVDSINDSDMILITSMCPNLTRLKLDECKQLTDSGMALFSKNCKKLKNFSCDYCSFSDLGIFELLDNSSQLEVLSVEVLISSLPAVKAPAKFHAGAAAKSLKVIKLWSVHNERLFEPLISASKNLTSLKLSCSDGSWERALEMIPHDSCLVEVHLEEVNVTDVGLISVAQNCRALKKLRVGNWYGSEIGDEGLIAVGKHSVNLQELSLIGIDASCVSLEVIAMNCQNLVSLWLCKGETITDVEMICIAKKCIALKILRIEKCHAVSDKGIEAFALGCPNLAEIEIIKCYKVTREVRDWLTARRGGQFECI